MAQELEILTPDQYGQATLAEFKRTIVAAGKVTETGLSRRILNARCLALFSVDAVLVGTGGLKLPDQSYREKIAEHTGIDLAQLNIELGWVAVLEEHWGKGIGPKIVDALASRPEADSAFATCEIDNIKIRKILERNGFFAIGREYLSEDAERILMVMQKQNNAIFTAAADQGRANAT